MDDRAVKYEERSGHPWQLNTTSRVICTHGNGMDQSFWYGGKLCICVGRRGCSGTCDGAVAVCYKPRASFKLWRFSCTKAVCFFFCCVCKCVYPHLTDLLSECGAALRINTDTLSAQVHTHTYTLLRSVSDLSVDRVFSSQPDGEHSEWKQILSPFGWPSIHQSLGLSGTGFKFLSTDWDFSALQPGHSGFLPSISTCIHPA